MNAAEARIIDEALPSVATMRAVVHSRYGTPDVLAFQEIERPVPREHEVLVRVHAAGASIGDHHVVTGKPYLIRLSPFGGLPRPRNRVPGTALAGRVEEVGARVTIFRPGDEVFGEARCGAFAEYAVIAADRLADKPINLSFEEAAATPWALTALQGLRDAGGLEAGQRVLINGASGGVGTWAVQIAKALGAEVTAVCSTRNIEMVRALGANHVIDYTREDFTSARPFDLILDVVGNRSLADCRRALAPRGTYVACSARGGDWFGPLFRLAALHATSLVSRQRLKSIVVTPSRRDLLTIKQLVEAGSARPIIERRYPLSAVADALRHVGQGHAQGQTIVVV